MTNSLKEGVAMAATVVIIALTSFRSNDNGTTDRPFLQAISNQAGSTLITYNSRHTISRLIRTQHTGEETYTDVRIPVYENGRLVSILVSDRANGDDSHLFAAFNYTADYSKIENIIIIQKG